MCLHATDKNKGYNFGPPDRREGPRSGEAHMVRLFVISVAEMKGLMFFDVIESVVKVIADAQKMSCPHWAIKFCAEFEYLVVKLRGYFKNFVLGYRYRL